MNLRLLTTLGLCLAAVFLSADAYQHACPRGYTFGLRNECFKLVRGYNLKLKRVCRHHHDDGHLYRIKSKSDAKNRLPRILDLLGAMHVKNLWTDAKPTRTGHWYYPRGSRVPTKRGTRVDRRKAGCLFYKRHHKSFARRNCGRGTKNEKIHGICYIRPKINGGYSPWSEWSECSITCEQPGQQMRDRSCNDPKPANGGKGCRGEPMLMRPCNMSHLACPIDGEWGTWTVGSCSGTCIDTVAVSTPTRENTRFCDSPPPSNASDPVPAGLDCPGSDTWIEQCDHLSECPIDGMWSEWTSTPCTVTCRTASDGGTVTKTRTCNDPEPDFGGTDCAASNGSSVGAGGTEVDTVACDTTVVPMCPIDGDWTPWANDGPCTMTCYVDITNRGTQPMKRTCSAPIPQHGGANCTGEDGASMYGASEDETKSPICLTNDVCPIDAVWHEWTPWSLCSTSCDVGSTSRERNCTQGNPTGTKCFSSNNNTVEVETDDCLPSVCMTPDMTLMVIGGYTSGGSPQGLPTTEIISFDGSVTVSGCTFADIISDDETGIFDAAAFLMNDTVVTSGGDTYTASDGTISMKYALMWDEANSVWKEVAKNNDRDHGEAVVINNHEVWKIMFRFETSDAKTKIFDYGNLDSNGRATSRDGPELSSKVVHFCLLRTSPTEIMIIGGTPAGANAPPTAEVWTYDLTTLEANGPFVPAAPLITARHSHSCAIVDGKPTVYGGVDSNGDLLDSVEEFDGSAWVERTPSPMPYPMKDFFTAHFGTSVYFVGGINATGITQDIVLATDTTASPNAPTTMTEMRGHPLFIPIPKDYFSCMA